MVPGAAVDGVPDGESDLPSSRHPERRSVERRRLRVSKEFLRATGNVPAFSRFTHPPKVV